MEEKKKSSSSVGCVVIVIFAFLIYFFTPSGSSAREKPTSVNALIESRQFVEKQLKAPATADFAGSTESSIEQISDNVFLVKSYVDAQNSFGAQLRTNYTCKITFLPGDRVQCDDLVLNE